MTAVFRVDLDAFAENLAEIRRRVAPAEHMLVVKDDAYGHGLEPIVRRAHAEGVRWFGAFDVRTGTAVRAVLGAEVRVFAWIVATLDETVAGVVADLDLGVGDAALLEDVAAAARATGRRARVHLKIDTGLHRNGVRPEDWPAFVARTVELESEGLVEVVGIWSHISEASDADDDDARREFDDAVAAARRAGLRPIRLHLAASAAAFARPEFRYDLVRIGAFGYGIRPSGGPDEGALGVRPIGALAAPVVGIGEASVDIGIGALHGLPSALVGALRVKTGDGPRAVESIGDTASTASPWPSAALGREVVVFGAGAPQSATDLAECVGTIGEEIVLRVSPLVPRVYLGSI